MLANSKKLYDTYQKIQNQSMLKSIISLERNVSY